uniref:Fad7 n=1 Tax=Arundo donax TaxID=35708 RepID=A0A0A9DI07_ARUDO
MVGSEDEERPEHGALRGPVEGPDELAVEARGGGGEDDVAQDVAHGAPGVLDPAVLGDGDADVGEPERRRRPGS